MKIKLWRPLLGLILAAAALGCFSACGGSGTNYTYELIPFLDVEYDDAARDAYGLGKMDIFYPGDPDLIEGPRNALLFIHGGNWIMGDKRDYGTFLDDVAKKSGWVVATMNYNTLFQFAYWQDMLKEIEKALDTLKTHAASQGVTLKKAALAGHSAGGHLALLYSYKEQANSPLPIALVAGLAGPADLMDLDMYDAKLNNVIPNSYGISFSIGVTFLTKTMAVEQHYIDTYNLGTREALTSIFTAVIQNNGVWYSSNGLRADPLDPSLPAAGTLAGTIPAAMKSAIEAASPATYVSAGVPPTLLFHGKKDLIVVPNNSALLETKLKTAGVEVKRYLYPDSGHRFGRKTAAEPEAGETDVWNDIVKKIVAKLKTIPAE
jgi:acetyl esterase/lipase